MKRLLQHSCALALAVLAAAPALSGDVTVGGRTELWYDDNVLGSEGGTLSDVELMISPKIEASERWGSLEGSLILKPTYELFFDEKDLRGWNYQADGALTWSPTPTTTFAFTEMFQRYRSLRLLTTAAPGGGTPAESGSRDLFNRNVAQLSARTRLTPIDTLTFSAGHNLWRFDDARRVDQDTYSASTRYQHYVTRTISLGAGASFSRLDANPTGPSPGRQTDYMNVSVIGSYEPVDSYTLNVSVGPTYVRQPEFRVPMLQRFQLMTFPGGNARVGLIPSTCPTLPTGEFYKAVNSDSGCNFGLLGFFPNAYVIAPVPFQGPRPDRDDLTYFADITAERHWPNGSLVVGYNRDEGSNSSVGFSSVADTFELRGSYQPFRELTLSAAFLWEDRTETQTGNQFVVILDTLSGGPGLPFINNLVPVALRAVNGASFAASVTSITTYLSAQYRLGPRARLDAAFSWRDQSASRTANFNDYERMQIMLGLTVELEPIRW